MDSKHPSSNKIILKLAEASPERMDSSRKRFSKTGERTVKTGESSQTWEFLPTQFVKHLISEQVETESEENPSLEPMNWNNAAKLLLKYSSIQRDKGKMLAHYNCVGLETGKEFTVEIILIPEKDLNFYNGYLLNIVDRNMLLTHVSKRNFCVVQHPLNEITENLTLVVGEKFLRSKHITGDRIIVLTNVSEVDAVTKILTSCAKFEENPVKWKDLSEETRNSFSANVPVMLKNQLVDSSLDLLENLEGKQLNQILQGKTLQIFSRKKLEFTDELHVHRWLLNLQMLTTDNQDNINTIVYNAEKSDLPEVSKLLQGHAFYIEDIEDLSYLPQESQIPVIGDLDCSVADKYLRTLVKASENRKPHTIQLLKYVNKSLFKVVPEQKILQQEVRLTVIIGSPADGKTWLLHRIYNECSDAVCIFTAKQLTEKLSISPAGDFDTEQIRDVIITDLAKSQFDRLVLEKVFETLKIVILIDDVNNEWESHLSTVVNGVLHLPNLSVVITTTTDNLNMGGINKSYVLLRLLGMSRTEKIHVITRRSMPVLTNMHAGTIFNHYSSKLGNLQTTIWTVVAEVFKKRFGAQQYRLEPENMPLNVKLAEIFDKFVELRYKSFMQRRREATGLLKQYAAIHKKKASNDTSEDCTELEEYFVDLFTLGVISGDISGNPEFVDNFHNFFIGRYVQPKSAASESHLNDMLGWYRRAASFPFDINKFNILDVLLVSGRYPHMCRVLFGSFLESPNKELFRQWYKSFDVSSVNVSKLLGFLKLNPPSNLKATDILLVVSTHLGFANLFYHIISEDIRSVNMSDIQIRERQSFKSLLHLLLYNSRDNNGLTIDQKGIIMSLILENDSSMFFVRDYFGNMPILERNVSTDLVFCLEELEVKIDYMDYTGCSILDKNADNPEFRSKLMWEYPHLFDKLNLQLQAKSEPLLMSVVPNINITDFAFSVDRIKGFLNECNKKNDGDPTLQQVAIYVRDLLSNGQYTDDFEDLLLEDIFATSQMAFKHRKLCNLLNSCLGERENIDFKISRHHHDLMCQRDSPFIVASITGHRNIARFLGKSFSIEWLEELKVFELSCLFQALDKYHSNDLLLDITKKLQDRKFSIPWRPVAECLTSGSLNLFRIFTEKLLFTPTRWVELKEGIGFGVMHYVLENSMHDSRAVLKQKELLIKYIMTLHPATVNVRDKHGRCALLLGRAHYQLIRLLIDNWEVDLQSEDKNGNNILNVCLGNIIQSSEYIGESAYDISLYQHEQVVYLAKRVEVNDLANKQILWIMKRTKKLVKVKTKALKAVGFNFEGIESTTSDQLKALTFDVNPDDMIIFDADEWENDTIPPCEEFEQVSRSDFELPDFSTELIDLSSPDQVQVITSCEEEVVKIMHDRLATRGDEIQPPVKTETEQNTNQMTSNFSDLSAFEGPTESKKCKLNWDSVSRDDEWALLDKSMPLDSRLIRVRLLNSVDSQSALNPTQKIKGKRNAERNVKNISIRTAFKHFNPLPALQPRSELQNRLDLLRDHSLNYESRMIGEDKSLTARLEVFVKTFVRCVEEVVQFHGLRTKRIRSVRKSAGDFSKQKILSKYSNHYPLEARNKIQVSTWLCLQQVDTRVVVLVEVAGAIFMSFEQPLMSVTGGKIESSWIDGVTLLAAAAAEKFLSVTASSVDMEVSLRVLQDSIRNTQFRYNTLISLAVELLTTHQYTYPKTFEGKVGIGKETMTVFDVYENAGLVKVNESGTVERFEGHNRKYYRRLLPRETFPTGLGIIKSELTGIDYKYELTTETLRSKLDELRLAICELLDPRMDMDYKAIMKPRETEETKTSVVGHAKERKKEIK